jgi:TolA-binding protein
MAKNSRKKSRDIRVITDEHPEFVGNVAQIFLKHRNLIGYLFMGFLVVGVLFLLMQHNNRVKNNEASALLQNALDQYQKDMAASTISFQTDADNDEAQMKVQARSPGNFQAVHDNFPQTNPGRNALYLAATSHLNLGDNQNALEIFERFIQSYPDNALIPSAKLGKATALFNIGQVTESLDMLHHIEQTYPDFTLKDVVIYEKAKRYESMENWTSAQNAYETIIEDFPDSAFKAMSDNALKTIEKHFPAGDTDTNSMLS